MIRSLTWIISILVVFLSVDVTTAQPVGWRTDGTGVYKNAHPVTEWDGQHNILWKTELPAGSGATPILVEGRLYFCAEPDSLICASAADGEILWRAECPLWEALPPGQAESWKQAHSRAIELHKEIRKLKRSPEDATALIAAEVELDELDKKLPVRIHDKEGYYKVGFYPPTNGSAGYSPCTPVSDGRRVCVLFGTGVAACYDLDGRRQWIKLLPVPDLLHGQSSSPVIAGGLFVAHLKSLVGLDLDTGEQRWTVDSIPPRHGSLIKATVAGEELVITLGGDFVRAKDGKLLATNCSGIHKVFDFYTPVAADGAVYYIGVNSRALRLPDTLAEPFEPQIVWDDKLLSGMCVGSPLVHDGLIYACNEAGIFIVVDAATGETVYKQRLSVSRAKAWPSLTLAGGHLFLPWTNGTIFVIEPGREFRQVAENRIEDYFRASPIFADDRIYIRGGKHLYCIGKKDAS